MRGTAETIGVHRHSVIAPVRTASFGRLASGRFLIEDIFPSVAGGRFAVKRVIGEAVDVWADIVREGHDVLAADLIWRRDDDTKWSRLPMRFHENDRWSASFVPREPGRYVYAIEAWTDVFATWRRDFFRKRDAGQDVKLEAQEGRELLASLKPRNITDAQVDFAGVRSLGPKR